MTPCAEVGCVAFARAGHATCAAHDPKVLAQQAKARRERRAALRRAVVDAAELVTGFPREGPHFDEDVRDLRRAADAYLKEMK